MPCFESKHTCGFGKPIGIGKFINHFDCSALDAALLQRNQKESFLEPQESKPIRSIFSETTFVGLKSFVQMVRFALLSKVLEHTFVADRRCLAPTPDTNAPEQMIDLMRQAHRDRKLMILSI